MRQIGRRLGIAVVAVFVAAVLAGCWLIPVKPTVEQLVGVWEFEAADGVVSTMTIEFDGSFEIDRAPIEVFSPTVNAAIDEWDEVVDWGRALPSRGEVSVDASGRVYFSAGMLDWGDAIAYPDLTAGRMGIFVGNPDYQKWVYYYRVEAPE